MIFDSSRHCYEIWRSVRAPTATRCETSELTLLRPRPVRAACVPSMEPNTRKMVVDFILGNLIRQNDCGTKRVVTSSRKNVLLLSRCSTGLPYNYLRGWTHELSYFISATAFSSSRLPSSHFECRFSLECERLQVFWSSTEWSPVHVFLTMSSMSLG